MYAAGAGLPWPCAPVSNGLLSAQDFLRQSLFCCGAYLLTEGISDPPDPLASGTVIVTAGFILSLASFLLTYLVWQRGKAVFIRSEQFNWQREVFGGPVVNAYRFVRKTRPETRWRLAESESQFPVRCEGKKKQALSGVRAS
jgi:hypothetical protein